MREHGSYVKYVQDHCRCDPCRAANRDYERARKQRVEPPYVGADRARQHMASLAAVGVGMKTVAKRSGVSHGCLWKLVYGKPGRGPSKRIRRTTEERILAVMPTDAADGARIPAAPTWKIIDELLERGWTKKAIAHAIGQKGDGLQISRRQVSPPNARAIKALLDEPVPPRRSRHGLHPVPQPEPEQPDPTSTAGVARGLIDLFLIDEGDTSWMRRGACRRPEVPTYLFFPGRGDTKTIAAAKAVCATCPVQADCLAYALRLDQPGIWGNTTARERDRS